MVATAKELNAAVAAYNEAAKRLGLVVLAGGIDETVVSGEPEHADEALAGLMLASECLLRWGSVLAVKAKQLARKRDLLDLPEAGTLVRTKLPQLLEAADVIDEMLV